MDQNITLHVAGFDYQFVAKSPEMERCLRLAAESVNSMFAKYDARYADKSKEHKLAIVAIQAAYGKIVAQSETSALKEEAASLGKDIERYLSDIEK